jgi:isochorismate synthase
MIHLSGKDSFVIYQDTISKKNKIAVGQWHLFDFKKQISKPSFVCNVFNKETYFIDGEISNLEKKVKIEKPELFDEKDVSKEDYKKSIEKIINYCNEDIIEKCILSRVVKSDFEISNYFKIFEKLSQTYSKGFKYILNHPKHGMWIGVSPETLIKGNFENGFFTHALAGSKSKNDNLKWSEKDYQEHKYVVDFIEGKIKENGYITKESKIEEEIAGEIIHLNKDFNFNLDIDFLSFVKTLHPTPAIAGIPLDKSLEIIHDLEVHNRSLYCGFLGTIDNKNCDLKVNLRCARFSAKEVQIFVGGGITSQSNPNDEFKETEIKSQTLLSVIKKK